MSDKEEVMAAILAAIDQFEEEEAQAASRPGHQVSRWKHWGRKETMDRRRLWQTRTGKGIDLHAGFRRK